MKNNQPPSSQPQFEEIRLLAYQLWEQAGCPSGADLDLWLEAEKHGMRQAQAMQGSSARAPQIMHAKAVTPSQSASPAKLSMKSTLKPDGNGAEKKPQSPPKKFAKMR